MFKPQKTLKKTGKKLYNTLAFPVLILVVKSGPLKLEKQEE
jgi:hypothetical protein